MQIAGLNQKILNKLSLNRETFISKIKTTGLYLLVPIVTFGVSVFTSPIFARYLSAEEFGYLGYYTSVAMFLTCFYSLLFPTYHMSIYFKYTETERRSVITSLVLFNLLWNILFFPLSYIGLNLYMKHSQSSMPFAPFAVLALGGASIANYKLFAQANFRLGQKAFLYFLMVAGFRIVSIAISLYFVVYAKMGLYGRMLGMVLTEVVFFIISLIHVLKGQRIYIQKEVIRRAFKIVLPLFPASFLYLPLINYDNIVLERLHQPAELGLYNIGKGIATYLYTALFPFYQTFEPEIYKNAVLKNVKSLRKTSFLLLFIVAISLIGFWICSPMLIRYLTAGKYTAALKYSNIIAVTSCLMIVFSIFDAIINALHETRKSLIINIISACLCILFYTLSAKYFAQVGVAYATVLAYLCLVCLQAFFVIRKFRKDTTPAVHQ